MLGHVVIIRHSSEKQSFKTIREVIINFYNRLLHILHLSPYECMVREIRLAAGNWTP